LKEFAHKDKLEPENKLDEDDEAGKHDSLKAQAGLTLSDKMSLWNNTDSRTDEYETINTNVDDKDEDEDKDKDGNEGYVIVYFPEA
jgi:hypothetical protein